MADCSSCGAVSLSRPVETTERLPDDMKERDVYSEYFNGNEEEVEDLRPYSLLLVDSASFQILYA